MRSGTPGLSSLQHNLVISHVLRNPVRTHSAPVHESSQTVNQCSSDSEPVIWLTTSSGAGPMASTVLDPAAISVLPASAIKQVGRLASFAAGRCHVGDVS